MEFIDNDREKLVKPVLRWAGGKSWLVEFLKIKIEGLEFNNYFEPFIGGAAVFISLKQNKIIKKEAFLSDCNNDLVNTYSVIKSNPQKLITSLKTFKNNKEFYYDIRSRQFDSVIDNAAKFIYLNRTSFNGIYRVNLRGEYNVPYGYKKYPTLFDFENLIGLSRLLHRTSLNVQDFEQISRKVKAGDLVFLDPPYTVAHENNGFVKYNQKIFSWEDQIRLRDFVVSLEQIGAYYILTNACHDSIKDLFSCCGKQHKLQRVSLIGGRKAKRGNVNELLFTNIF